MRESEGQEEPKELAEFEEYKKQKIKLTETLLRTKLVGYMVISGKIEQEKEELIFRFGPSEDLTFQQFRRKKIKLESRLIDLLEKNFPFLSYDCNYDPLGHCTIKLMRCPYEGVSENPTKEVLTTLNKDINNYLLSTQKL